MSRSMRVPNECLAVFIQFIKLLKPGDVSTPSHVLKVVWIFHKASTPQRNSLRVKVIRLQEPQALRTTEAHHSLFLSNALRY